MAGSADVDQLRAVGDAGQREWRRSVVADPSAQAQQPTTATTWARHRSELARTGVNGLLTFAFPTGGAGGTGLALLAVGFVVLAGARQRGQVLARLRTIGGSHRQGRSLLGVEFAPWLMVGVGTGVAAGAALPALLLAAIGMVALGLLAAVAVEVAVNRRLRLGEVLRAGVAAG